MFLFKKKQPAVGITSRELQAIRETIQNEFVKTQENHKKPTEYMRGLQFALDVLCDVSAHEL